MACVSAPKPQNTIRLGRAPLLIALAVGLILRALLWGHLPRTGLISDEGEYLAAASWLAEGRSFSWYFGYLWTRAPVYPLFVAAHLWLFGRVEVVYASQTVLSLLNVALVYLLALRLTPEVREDTETQRHGDTEKARLQIADYRLQIAGFRRSPFVFRLLKTTLLPSTVRRLPSTVPAIAALLMAVYLPFALYTQVLLSETLYLTLLLSGFLLLASDDRRPATGDRQLLGAVRWPLLVAGGVFGLASLTRSLTLGFVPVIVLWLLARRWTVNGERLPIHRPPSTVHRFLPAAAFTLTFCLTVLPWTAYNSTRLYGGLVVVDTTGAFNLMLGARTAYDGHRADAPPRQFALALLGQMNPTERSTYLKSEVANGGSCLLEHHDPALEAALERTPIAQAELQRLMTAEGLCLIREKPWAFVQKTAGEFLDFFQINYSGDERFTDGFALGRLPPWYTLALFLLDDTLYVLALPLAAVGYLLARRLQLGRRNLQSAICNLHFLILLWFLFNIAVAPVLFAINRFRLPLLPFVFIFAAYALAQLPHVGWSWLRSRASVFAAVVAVALFLVAATPYAYFEPRAKATDSEWASYFGPYPSSLGSTGLALARRGSFLEQEQMRQALRIGDVTGAQALRPAEVRFARVGKTTAVTDTVLLDALLAHAAGRDDDALALLPQDRISAFGDVEAAVVRGDILRSRGQNAEANHILTAQFVDDANPVQWAWDWLDPQPTNKINIGGNLDIGYLRGCYLGESIRAFDDANYRWCSDGAQIRFPKAGSGAAQTLLLRADGRGWQGFAPTPPPVRVQTGNSQAGSFTPNIAGPQEFSVTLPPTPIGQDVLITLRTPTFIPNAGDYNKQQGPLAGQVRRLGVRLDWVELR